MKTINCIATILVLGSTFLLGGCAKSYQESAQPDTASKVERSLRTIEQAKTSNADQRYEKAKQGILNYAITKEGSAITDLNFAVMKLFAEHVATNDWRSLDQALNKLYQQPDGHWQHAPGSEPAALGMLEHLLLRIEQPNRAERQAILTYAQRLIGWQSVEWELLANALQKVRDGSAQWKSLATKLSQHANAAIQSDNASLALEKARAQPESRESAYIIDMLHRSIGRANYAVATLGSSR